MGPLPLAAVLAAMAGEDTAGAASPLAPPARVVVVAIAGKVSPAEAASGPDLAAGGLGKAGPGAALLENVSFVLPPETGRIEALRAALLPPGAAAATVRLGGSVQPAAPSGRTPRAIKDLRARFGDPPPPSAEEAAAVAHLRKAAGGPGAPRAAPADREASLDAIRTARVALVVIDADDASAEAARRRGDAVQRVLEAAGDGAHALIACVPERGPGSVLARGPLFRPGLVVRAEKPAGVVAAAVRRILAGVAAGKEPDEAADLFREEPTR
jgi:hypothetical protein